MLHFIFLTFVALTKTYVFAKRVDNICSVENAKILLRLGDSGVVTAHNVNFTHNNTTYHESCHLQILTCPSCVITLTFTNMNLSCHCPNNINLFLYNPCRCDFVWVSEPQYESSGTSFYKIIRGGNENEILSYKSKTRGVNIVLFYSRPHAYAFSLEYKSELNRQFFLGKLEKNSTRGFITSPFFPAPYPRDLISEYIISCGVYKEKNLLFLKPTTDSLCKIHLAFTDFFLGLSSVIEFYDGRHRIDMTTGSSFRPPIIITATNSLTVRFYASGQSNLGFKAVYTFLTDNHIKKLAKPSVDCGGLVENEGGTITMMNMADSEVKLYDCIWLIKPVKNIFSVKSHLYLKVTNFLDFAGQADLEIRQGLTSESPLLENVHYPVDQRFREHVVPLEFGYYVSVKALFGAASHLAIAYSSFSYNQCFVLTDFICQNYRCIPKKLRCDGFDHCGDGSDEPGICYKEWSLEPTAGRWYTHSPNYYFPKIKNYSDLHTASVVVLASLVALVFLASAISLVLYRMSGRTRQTSQFQLSLSDFQDDFSDEVYVESLSIDDPPRYEPPPNYEDVIQEDMDKPVHLYRSNSAILKEEKVEVSSKEQKKKKKNLNPSFHSGFFIRNLFSSGSSHSSSLSGPSSETPTDNNSFEY